VQAGVGAESLDAPQNGRTGEAFLANALDDRLVQRLPRRLTSPSSP
jgi:hypothetical protein